VGRGHVGRLRLTLAAAVVFATAAAALPASSAVSWSTVVRGSRSGGGGDGADALVARTRAAADAVARRMRAADAIRVRETNFRRFGVAAVVHGFPSCGWSVRIRGVERRGSVLRVSYSARPPVKDDVVCQAATVAYEVVRVPLAQLRGIREAQPVQRS